MTNYEKFKTANERAVAFMKHAEICGITICGGEEKDITRQLYEAAFAWLDLEAEDEKPLPCPFCGAPVSYDDKKECIECFCGYRSTSVSSKDVTIEAHNRICRADAKGRESAK